MFNSHIFITVSTFLHQNGRVETTGSSTRGPWVQLYNEMIKGFWLVTATSVPADNVAAETRNIFLLSFFFIKKTMSSTKKTEICKL